MAICTTVHRHHTVAVSLVKRLLQTTVNVNRVEEDEGLPCKIWVRVWGFKSFNRAKGEVPTEFTNLFLSKLRFQLLIALFADRSRST
ncbi:uncharacterized protein DS421_9g265490 [Arachis hypogaea]|nr:uncharacterized protein DS421_9g265490 [Arachis hypogaea]